MMRWRAAIFAALISGCATHHSLPEHAGSAVTVPATEPATRPAFGSPAFNAEKDSRPAPVDISRIPDAVPRAEPLARYGNTSPYTVWGQSYTIMPSAKGYRETGIASWYGNKFHALRTSSGEPYDVYGMTAAHRSLPLPTYVRVTNVGNGRSVVVKVNDRGPFHSDRIMDLSYAAALKLDIVRTGTATVNIEALNPEAPAAPAGSSPAESLPRYFVQVGAFSRLENATALQARLQDKVYSPVEVTHDGLHRVQVGPFLSYEDAQKMSAIIREDQFGEPRIIGP